MENVISKIVEYIVSKKFPEFTGVDVTSSPDYGSRYSDKGRNIKYNVFLTIDYSDFSPINNSGEWDNLKSNIRNIIKISGIENRIQIYVNFSDEDK